jgi:hypothetical protein
MKNLVSAVLKSIVIICVVVSAALLYSSFNEKKSESEIQNQKAVILKKFLQRYNKPVRIEVTSLTQRYSADADEIKKLKLPTDQKSKFYISINLFTDETDNQAPLVAQIKFMDVATENKLSEENINLE